MASTDQILKLIHYKDSLMFSEVVNCSAIELKFKGKFIGESKLSDDWYVGTGINKIICVSFSGNQDVSELFTFQGSFVITRIKIITQELDEISCGYDILDIDYFKKSREKFDEAGSSFSDYNSTHEEIDTIDNTDIYRNNLFTKQDEFYLLNGENYFGEYHQHSNGQAMSGSSHTSDSVQIFRKDQNNKIYKPKSKRLKVIEKEEEFMITEDKERKYKGQITREGEDRGTGEAGTGGSTGGGGAGY